MLKRSKNSFGFTLLELLIAMGLTSFILMALMQSYRAAIKYIERSRGMMVTNRRACLCFNQIERDFMCAFIPESYKEVKSKKDQASGAQTQEQEEKPEDQMTPEEKEQAKAKKIAIKKEFFIGTIHEGEFARINKKRYELFKNTTFITTEALQVYDKKKARIVRVMYELVADKKASKGDKTSYVLYRRESADLKNVKMKVDQFELDKAKISSIASYIVAQGIKSMHIEYVTLKPEKKRDKKDTQEQKEPEERRFFTWGEKKETMGVVPQRVEITIVFWNDELTDSQTFQVMVPVLAFPTEPEEKLKKKDAGKSVADNTSSDDQAQAALKISGQAQATGPSAATQVDQSGISNIAQFFGGNQTP